MKDKVATQGPLGAWAAKPDEVTAKFIGYPAAELKAGEVVCASFNAG